MKDFVRVRHHVFPQGTLHELVNGRWVGVKRKRLIKKEEKEAKP